MIVLCADDYALTEGVSRAVGELAAARRLSATSVMVTTPHWPATAPRLRVHRGRLAVGLHLNLTLGAPLGAMPRLRARQDLPEAQRGHRPGAAGPRGAARDRPEIERQLDAFEKALGFPPDHIDGHEHVHVLSGIRQPLLEVVARRYPGAKPLMRDPSDRWQAIAAAAARASRPWRWRALALRFGAGARGAGPADQRGLFGLLGLRRRRALRPGAGGRPCEPGPRHIVMCHPGHPDAELAAIDPVVERRRMEYDALMRDVRCPSASGGPRAAPTARRWTGRTAGGDA